jgi:hypothetical protein
MDSPMNKHLCRRKRLLLPHGVKASKSSGLNEAELSLKLSPRTARRPRIRIEIHRLGMTAPPWCLTAAWARLLAR